MSSLNLYRKYQKKKKDEMLHTDAEHQFGIRPEDKIIVIEKKKRGQFGNMLFFLFCLFVIIIGLAVVSIVVTNQDLRPLKSQIIYFIRSIFR